MAKPVVSGATAVCTKGTAPARLQASSQSAVKLGGKRAATVQDSTAANLSSFGMCSSLANPAVASATAAALGVLTPMPCVPMLIGIWTCGGGPKIGGKPALTNEGSLRCAYAGLIRITSPGCSGITF